MKQANAAVMVPGIEWVFYHPRVLACARQALGSDQVMFTSHADVQKNVMGGWHKDYDDSNRVDLAGSHECSVFDCDDFAVYKFGLYLYDHDRDGGGLWVRDGSHRLKENVGPIHDTAPRAGSIVVFDLRITHSGVPTSKWEGRLVDLPSRLPRITRRIADAGAARARQAYLAMTGRRRMAIFFTFGLANRHTLEFAKYIIEKQQGLEPGTSANLPCSLRDALIQNNVLLAEDQILAS